ncbi:MAG: hypothetical protein R2793_08515 [Flavobacteriaceae bacterium]
MKTSFLKSLLVFSMVLAFTACSQGEDPAPFTPNETSADQTTQVAQSGTWRITSYIDSGQDETSDFSGYEFTFNANGTVTATKGGETVSGTWSITDDSSNSSSDDDGNSTDDDDFNLFFAVSQDSKFDSLSDDWNFISVSASKIELVHVSGGNGGTDYLTFQKN